MARVDPENIRLAIAKQPSVAQSIAALLRAVTTAAHNAVDKPDPEALMQFARHIDDNPRAWVDAVFANTPAAEETMGLELVALPTEVRDAFADHGSHAQAEAAAQQQAQKDRAQQDPHKK